MLIIGKLKRIMGSW